MYCTIPMMILMSLLMVHLETDVSCVERGIRTLVPSPDGVYIGFKENQLQFSIHVCVSKKIDVEFVIQIYVNYSYANIYIFKWVKKNHLVNSNEFFVWV